MTIEVLEERIRGMEVAGRIQTAELARRLEELNHAHKRAVDDRNLFLTKDEYHAAHEALVTTVDTLRDTVNQWRGRDMMVTVGASAIFSLVMFAIAHWWK